MVRLFRTLYFSCLLLLTNTRMVSNPVFFLPALLVKMFILIALFYLLGDEGDACLIPAPYYAAFESDMSLVARIVPFAVRMANPIQGPSASELDLAYIEAKSVRSFFVIINSSSERLQLYTIRSPSTICTKTSSESSAIFFLRR